MLPYKGNDGIRLGFRMKNLPEVWMVGWKVRDGGKETTSGNAVRPSPCISLSSLIVKCCLERQTRPTVKSRAFSVKARVDSNHSPVAYGLHALGNYPVKFSFTLL